ncbi:hypothetical protein SARC_01417 [Sphaeroforma arctica JP610]|uniref:Uncharacterized protein n=1 Tax=Sphaeroforma arctica JP610 TaxID=667725 RepID=A0A0L0GC35_9EUKA|nr:hypothetical protein SARC_01417 [Sphaeroforma arctica JP610]KNC86461.1 hypothetical protein SARC_01417 [Sphaeroforma arctica JP610]|eukprot:XP_014160363.1 hypothetical protein SARC_01417 [Sphaeroforma arctica JP610]
MRARAIMDSLYRAGMLVHPGQKMHESVEVHNHYGYNTYSRDEFVFPSGYGPQALEPEVYDTDSESARSLAGDGVRIKSCTDNGVDEHPKVAKGKLRFTGVEFVPRMGIQNLAENTESKHMNVRADADLARTTEEGQTKVRKGRKRDPAVCKQMEKLEFISVGMQTGTDKVTTDMSTQPSNSTEMSSVPTVGQSIRRDRRANKQQLAADSHCAHGNGVEVVLESNTACEQITIPRLATAKCTDPPCVHRNDKEPFSESNAMTDGTQSLAARSLSTLSSRARRPSNWEKDTSQCTTGIRKTRRVLLPTPRRHSMPATTGAMCARTFQMTIPDWRIEPQTVALKKSDWLSRAWGPVTESVIAPLEVCSGRVPSVHPSRYPDACRKFSLDTGSRFWAKEKDVVRGLQATEAVDTPISGYTPARKIVELPANENLSAIGDPSDSRGCISGVGAVDIATEPRASTGAIEGEGGAMLDTSRTGSGVYLCDMDIDNVRDKNFNINADPVREPYGTDVSSTSGDNVNVIPERKYKEANVIGAHASNEASGSAQMHENLPQVGFLSPEMRAADSKQEQCGSSPDDSVVVLSRRRNGVDIGKGRSTLHSHGIDVIVLSPKANVVENGSGGCGTSKLHDSGSSASSREKSTIESKDLVIGDIIAPTNNETIDSENGVIAMSPERRAADMDTGKCGMSASHARGLVVPSSEMRTGHTDKAKCGKIPPNSTKVCPKISFLPRSAFGPPTKEKAHKASVPGKQLARNADGTNDCSGDRGSHTCGLPHAQAWTTKGVGKASKSSYASASNGKVREHMRNLGMHNKRLDAQNGNADVQVDTPVPDLPQKPVRALAQSAWGKAPVFAAEKKTQAAKSVLTTPTTQSQVHGLENTRITSTETDGGGWGEAIAKQIVKNGFVDEPIRDYSEKLHAHTPEQGLVHTLTKQPQAHNLTSQSAHAPVGAQSTAHAPVGAQSTAHTHIQGVAHLHGHGHGSGLVSKPAVSMGRGRTGRGRGRRSTESQGPKLGPNSIWYTKFNVRLNPDVAEFSP